MENVDLSYILFPDYSAITGFPTESTEIILPDAIGGKPVRVIAAGAFADKRKLRELTLPSTLLEIEERAFANCTSLTQVHFPEGLQSIHSSAFAGCSNLKEIALPESLHLIGKRAFEKCAALKELQVPGQVRTVADWAFSQCTSLENVTLAEGVTEIGTFAFNGCIALKQVWLPATFTALGEYAFSHGEAFFVGDDNPFFTHREGVLYNKSSQTLLLFPPNHPTMNYTIPAGVKVIDKNAFYACGKLEGVQFPEGLESIEDYAFAFCKRLKAVDFPESLNHIGKFAFYNCVRLRAIRIPDRIQSIEKSAFSFCENLEQVILPEGLSEIGENAFAQSTYLKRIQFPTTLKTIQAGAFTLCKVLPGCYLPDGLEHIGAKAFFQCSGLKSISLPSSIRNVAEDALEVDHYGTANLIQILVRGGSSEHKMIIPRATSELRVSYLRSVTQFFGVGNSFAAYDDLFAQVSKKQEKVWIAFNRLKDGFRLSEEHYKIYLEFLRQNAQSIVELLIQNDQTDSIELLSKLLIITSTNINDMIEKAQSLRRTEVQTWLMDYKNRKFGTKELSFVL